MFCLQRNNCIYTVYMKLVRKGIKSFVCIFRIFNGSRYFQLPNSDEMATFYTEHDFQVDLENFDSNLKFPAERIQHNYRLE